ncbi:MAG TPA: carbohydrate ABC transporter permease [Chloroflexi bacterium]|nr:carbohydrate ABC transporter permease [Chloroflexota bacterium]
MWASARSHPTFLTPHRKRRISRGLVFALLILLMVFILFPYYWTIVTTLKPPQEQFDRVPSFLPRTWTLSNYTWILTQKPFLRSLLNSVIVASITAVAATVLNSLSAYSLARFQYKGKQIVIAFLLGTQMMPGVLTIVPLFVIFSRLGLANSHLGLILGFCTFSVPFSMLILRGFFESLPPDLEEAAIIDGCSRLGAFVRVVVPLAMPGISTAALFVFVGAWNDLLFSMIISMDVSTKTAAVALSEMITNQFAATNWGGMIAEGAIMTFPVAIVFVFLQRYLIEGLTAGAIKG